MSPATRVVPPEKDHIPDRREARLRAGRTLTLPQCEPREQAAGGITPARDLAERWPPYFFAMQPAYESTANVNSHNERARTCSRRNPDLRAAPLQEAPTCGAAPEKSIWLSNVRPTRMAKADFTQTRRKLRWKIWRTSLDASEMKVE